MITINRIEEQYYEMSYRLLPGVVFDAEIKGQVQDILNEAKNRIRDLIKKNPEHCKECENSFVYPYGKQTDFNYIAPPNWMTLTMENRLNLMDKAFGVTPVEYLFQSDKFELDRIKAFAQRYIEDDIDRKEASDGK